MCACHTVYVEVRIRRRDQVSPSTRWTLGLKSVARCGGKYLYLLSHPILSHTLNYTFDKYLYHSDKDSCCLLGIYSKGTACPLLLRPLPFLVYNCLVATSF